ncbi:MAG: GNAT family N-acetyltransferase [Janthinobacterium lividum]
MIETAQISFQPFREDDLPRLLTWLSAPHVAAWWKPSASTEIRAKYLPRLRGETVVQVYAILLNLEPVGMVQVHPVDGDASADACGIDLLIGNYSLISRGLGSQIIGEFVRNEVFGRLGFSVCVADPDATNQRSVRAFEKAGFVHRRFAEADGVTANIMSRQATHLEASTPTSSHEVGPGPSPIST